MKYLLGLGGCALATGIAIVIALGLDRVGVTLGPLAGVAIGYIFGTVGFYAGLLWGEDIEQRRWHREWTENQARMDAAIWRDLQDNTFSGRNVWAEYLKERKP